MFFSLKLLCSLDIYNINHYASIIFKNRFFFPIGHSIANVLNPMSHLICSACLVLASIVRVTLETTRT